MDDVNKALDTIKELLKTEDGQKTINSLIQSIKGPDMPMDNPTEYRQEEASIPASAPSYGGGGFDINNLGRFSELLTSVQSGSNAPRMQLMHALRPYLSSRRQQRFGVLMNLMKYSDVPANLMNRFNKR